MAAPTETYIDPNEGASAGNDFGGATFADGSFANATNTLTKIGAFPAATTVAGDLIFLTDNGSAEVSDGLYSIVTRTDDDNVVLGAGPTQADGDIRSGANDPTDVKCTQHDGTINLAWATVQHALNFTTQDGTNGDRFNLKTGTDDVLAASLDFSTFGTGMGANDPLIVRGYTSSAGDGGIGGLDGDGSVSIFASHAQSYVFLKDLHCHNCGSADVLALDNNCTVESCEVDESTGGGILCHAVGKVYNNYVHNIAARGINVGNTLGSEVYGNYLANGTNKFTAAIDATGYIVSNNVINLFGSGNASIGIDYGSESTIRNNSVWCDAGTGKGLHPVADGSRSGVQLVNNIVEGFSGVGGVGIEINAGGSIQLYGFNSVFNCATPYDVTGDIFLDLGSNETLGSSPFANPGGEDFTVDTSVKATAWPLAFRGGSTDQAMDRGAAQRVEAGGGGLLVHPGTSGGARG